MPTGSGAHDLVAGGLRAFAAAIQAAVTLGFNDEVNRVASPSGGELAMRVCSSYRRGHVRALRAAYLGGRLHAHYLTNAEGTAPARNGAEDETP